MEWLLHCEASSQEVFVAEWWMGVVCCRNVQYLRDNDDDGGNDDDDDDDVTYTAHIYLFVHTLRMRTYRLTHLSTR